MKIHPAQSYTGPKIKSRKISYYELGVLYELLPREIALPLFAKNHFVPNKYKINMGNKLLLCFSTIEEAAKFTHTLWQKYPYQTECLLKWYSDAEALPYFRYERSEFLELFDSKRIGSIRI